MRGDGIEPQPHMWSYVPLEQRIPADHPLRLLRTVVDVVLRELSPQFDQLYAKVGRPSIPPEHLLRALLLQVLYSVRSERLLMEQLDYLDDPALNRAPPELVVDVGCGPGHASAAMQKRWPKAHVIGLDLAQPMLGEARGHAGGWRPSFLPGVAIEGGVLVVDEERLRYPGDLLHEAGHLAILPHHARRKIQGDAGPDGGFEAGAMAWSYAAAVHLGIDPAIVFHEDGYKGASPSILENFAKGRYIGVPILEWVGLTTAKSYPAMRAWLRE